MYVLVDARGRGLGKLLIEELIRRAREAQAHVLVGCICSRTDQD